MPQMLSWVVDREAKAGDWEHSGWFGVVYGVSWTISALCWQVEWFLATQDATSSDIAMCFVFAVSIDILIEFVDSFAVVSWSVLSGSNKKFTFVAYVELLCMF